MYKVLCVVALAAACSALTFQEWQVKHGKSFSGTEAIIRAQIFQENDAFITAFNKQNASYTLAHNEFSHLSHAEFKRVYLPSAMVGTVHNK